MSRLPAPSVVLFVVDVPRVTRFYEALAAMTLLHEDPSHAVLEVEGFQLVVHAMHGAPEPEAGAAVVAREDSYMKVCLPVASIAVARDLAAAHGGHVKPASAEWSAREYRACDGHDPEGNVLQVREPVE